MFSEVFNPNDALWKVVTRTHGGRTEIHADLTEEQAAKLYERLHPFFNKHFTECVVHPEFGGPKPEERTVTTAGRLLTSEDISNVDVFGPAGWVWFRPGVVGVWPKVTWVFTDKSGRILEDCYQGSLAASRLMRMRNRP